MEPLMETSEKEILKNIINPEYSKIKLQDMFWDLAEEEQVRATIHSIRKGGSNDPPFLASKS